VLLNVFGMEAYATPAVVAYRQVAFSSVVRLTVACVVPAASVPDGCPFVRTGGTVSLAVIAPAANDRTFTEGPLLNTAAEIPGCPVVYSVPVAL
jgi:hypothetical protein